MGAKAHFATVLTKHSPRWHRFSVQPERHLGKNDCHDAGEVRLDDKVADLPLQMEMSRHHCVFTYGEMIRGQLTEQHSCHSGDHFVQTLTPDFSIFFFFSCFSDILKRSSSSQNTCRSTMTVFFSFFSPPLFTRFRFSSF